MVTVIAVLVLLPAFQQEAFATKRQATRLFKKVARFVIPTYGAELIGETEAELVSLGDAWGYATPILQEGRVYVLVAAGCKDAVGVATAVADLDGNVLELQEAGSAPRLAVSVFSPEETGVYQVGVVFPAGSDYRAHVKVGIYVLPARAALTRPPAATPAGQVGRVPEEPGKERPRGTQWGQWL